MANHKELLTAFQETGRVWLRGALSKRELQRLDELALQDGRPGKRIDPESSLFECLTNAQFNERIRAVWPGMRPVRLVSFEKAERSNWGVPWHQDRIIAVRGHANVRGFSNWSCKAGVWHCEPPLKVLEGMLFVRVHLDRNTAENGAMEIALGSHCAGKLETRHAQLAAEKYETETTVAEPGDVLILSMLTLHRSLPASTLEGRRAFRVDYASQPLGRGLEWSI
ncbi:phytanoyl-CoA dioxygenase family protein [Shimia sediminis]|uniref:phytanoyl-CoA dioxygenase family protein n=1 Tax=Shimia sediminis TaxID=2497945 RepID=UPI000F8D28A9|nr:phytanoyl-CoA dioxygenase family protein [Shimia sediminis]